MKRLSTMILRFAIWAAGVVGIAICGGVIYLVTTVNPSSVYFVCSIVLLAGICFAEIPYYTALFQSFKLLGYIDTNRAFSDLSVKALKLITRSAFTEFLICTLGGLPFFYVMAQIDDAPGFVIIGLVIASAAFVICVFASVLNRLLQDIIVIKSENDLTI